VFIAPLPLAIVGVVVSSTALRRTVPGDVDRRRAIAGIITGILGILIPVLMIITLSSFGS
jgi:hypothetical protein